MKSEVGSLRTSLVASTGLHVGMLLFLYYGLPNLFGAPPPLPVNWRPIPVDIVEIGDITNTRIGSKSEESAPKQPTPKPLPEAKTPVKAEMKPSEEQKQQMTEDELALAPKPKTKPAPPEPPKPSSLQAQQDQLASVLKNVAKLKPAAPKVEETPAATDKGGMGAGEAKGSGPSLSDRLTISEEDALRRQISSCWNMPVGARNAENLIVEVLIEVNPDRTVREARIVDQMRMATDTYFRAAAEAALRALRNPRCNPLEYDPAKNGTTIRFNFDPRDML